MKKTINTTNAPQAIGPYSQAVQTKNNILFVSGQIPVDPQTGKIPDDIENQTHQVMKNIAAILTEAQAGFPNILKASIFLQSLEHFEVVNKIYGSYFEEPYPARECVQVARLPKDVLVEISVIAEL